MLINKNSKSELKDSYKFEFSTGYPISRTKMCIVLPFPRNLAVNFSALVLGFKFFSLSQFIATVHASNPAQILVIKIIISQIVLMHQCTFCPTGESSKGNTIFKFYLDLNIKYR